MDKESKKDGHIYIYRERGGGVSEIERDVKETKSMNKNGKERQSERKKDR